MAPLYDTYIRVVTSRQGETHMLDYAFFIEGIRSISKYYNPISIYLIAAILSLNSVSASGVLES
jgi:hypothetical protein